jgi:signal transduction histidine kinase
LVSVTVTDNGRARKVCDGASGAEAPPQLSGLARLRRRFEGRGGGLAFDLGDGSGAALRVWLPRPAPGGPGMAGG